MFQKNESNPHTHTTSLYDPAIGFIFAIDLFEKDLYREKIIETRSTANVEKFPALKRTQTTRVNP